MSAVVDAPMIGLSLPPDESQSLVASGVLISRATDTGIVVTGENTELTLQDAAVIQTRPLPDGTWGRGLEVALDARAELTRVGR